MKNAETVTTVGQGLGSGTQVNSNRSWLTNVVGRLGNARSYMLGTILPMLKEQAWNGVNNFVLGPIDRVFIRVLPDKPLFRSLARSGVIVILTAALSFTVLNQALPLLLSVCSAITLQATASLQLEREDFLGRHGVDRQNVASSQLPLIMGVFGFALAVKMGDINAITIALASMSMALRLGVEINYREELKKAFFESLKELESMSEQLASSGARDTQIYRRFKASEADLKTAKSLIEDDDKTLEEKKAGLTALHRKYSTQAEGLKKELAQLRGECEAMRAKLNLSGSFEEIREVFQNKLIERQQKLARDIKAKEKAKAKSKGGLFGSIKSAVSVAAGLALMVVEAPVTAFRFVGSDQDKTYSGMLNNGAAVNLINPYAPELWESIAGGQDSRDGSSQVAGDQPLTVDEHELLRKLSEYLGKEVEQIDTQKTQYLLEVLKRSAELEAGNKSVPLIKIPGQLAKKLGDFIERPMDGVGLAR
jgi:hypothetical protein